MHTQNRLTRVEVTRLVMDKRKEFTPKENFADRVLARRLPNSGSTHLHYYSETGKPWGWNERLHWSPGRWNLHFEMNEIFFYLVYTGKRVIGYFELNRNASEEIEILRYGLLPHFLNQGIGGAFLSLAVHTAWRFYPEKIIMRVSEIDSPRAVFNALARGFKIEEIGTDLQMLEGAQSKIALSSSGQ